MLMLKGITTTPKLFIKKILLEDGAVTGWYQEGYVDLYTDAFKPDAADKKNSISKKLQCTLEFDIKFKYPAYLQNQIKEKSIGYINFQSDVKELLHKSVLQGYVQDDSALYKQFLTLDVEKQEHLAESYLSAKPGTPKAKSPFSTQGGLIKIDTDLIDDLSNYTYYDDGIPYVSIPQTCTFKYEGVGEGKNPLFLACIYALYTPTFPPMAPTLLPGTLSSDVIFRNGDIVKNSGYFMISDTYNYKGEEESLFKTTVFTDVGDKDPITNIPLKATKAMPLVEQVNINYGAPGDMWVGPVHWQKYIKSDDNNDGTYRPMAGTGHDPNNPHPYLEYVYTSNNKIIDFRSIGAIEKLFQYNWDGFEEALALQAHTTSVMRTDTKNTLDEMSGKQAIVSEINYSIRPTTHKDANNNTIEKDNIHFVFAIDKLKLLKETTVLPGLLDKLIYVSSGFMNFLVNKINIFHFEIIRINKTTGVSKSLITGNNDMLFSDADAKNYQGYNTSKGFRLRNKTAVIASHAPAGYISFYEFTDGEIDVAKYDSNQYAYKIKLKFRDPMITFLSDKLGQVRNIIKDLDELLFKSTLKMFDKGLKKYVSVYDKYKSQFNAEFVEESLDPPSKPQLPLQFKFSQNELPNSVEAGFYGPTGLTYLLVALNDHDKLEPYKNFSGPQDTLTNLVLLLTVGIQFYIKNSLTLSTTNPTLIQKVRALLALMENRFSKSLLLYTTENVTKKETSFQFSDYYKSTSVQNAGTHVTSFDHIFEEIIDLSKTKNRMNWTGLAKQEDSSKGLQVINVPEYKSLVTANKKNLLDNESIGSVGDDNLFSYAFVPYTNCLVHFFNREFRLIELLSPATFEYQAVRKKIFDNITGKKNHVLIPEILSYFGIKFALPLQTISEMYEDPIESDQQGLGFQFPDNFGIGFDPTKPIENQTPDSAESTAPSFGSAQDPEFEWQGMSYKKYPLVLAETIINLLTTDNRTKSKSIGYLREKYSEINPTLVPPIGAPKLGPLGIFANKSVPYEINLFSTTNIATAAQATPPFSESYVKAFMLNMLFAQDGDINYDDYPLMMLFLGLFGKVYYFTGFQKGKITDNLTPSSHADRNLIKSMNWAPIRRQTLDNLPVNKQLYCKIELFTGEDHHELLDQRVINLFKNFYTYNKYFFIKSSTTVSSQSQTLPDFNIFNITSLTGGSQNMILDAINKNVDLRGAVALGITDMVSKTSDLFSQLQEKTLTSKEASGATSAKKDIINVEKEINININTEATADTTKKIKTKTDMLLQNIASKDTKRNK